MNLLVTGGAGFIGSHFIKHIINTHPTYQVINFDALTYAGNLDNVAEVSHLSRYHFVKGDIADRGAVLAVMNEYDIDAVINFAAESHVDKSIEGPDVFVRTNVLGTQTLLHAALENNIKRFIQISTDEVYGSLGAEGYFTEKTPLAPNSPYSASKASADLIVRSYFETFNMNVNITRCSNNYGPNQNSEKLIPLMISKAVAGEKLPVYGSGLNVRDWLHVKDHCQAIDDVLHKGKPGEVYNIGGDNEWTNIDIVRKILNELKASEELITFVTDRKGHDHRYAIDPAKITAELGWKPQYEFSEGLIETINWYKSRLVLESAE
jgi:dTDP-glucose 4,6-dehydratase